MKIATIYTLYGRRAGAELLFEKTIKDIVSNYNDVLITIFCNKNAIPVLKGINSNSIEIRYERFLDNQILKIFWLLFLSLFKVTKKFDCFWIPSGTNGFPGKWPINTLVTFLDFGELKVPQKYDFKRTVYRKYFCIPNSIKRGKLFTVISDSTRDDLISFFKKESIVIYPGVSPRPIIKDIEEPFKIIQNECNLDLKGKILFTPGRTDFYGKGLDTLLQSYNNLLKKNLKLPLLILVGPQGEFHEQLLEEIEKNDLTDYIKYLGIVSSNCLDALYMVSLATIIPSKFEGFGFPSLESMYHGVPLICSNGGSLPEVVGSAAKIFNVGDEKQLAESIEEIIKDESVRQTLIAKGNERVKLYSWENSYIKMYELFNKISKE